LARLKHKLEYLASQAVASLARRLSPTAADRLGAALGRITYNLAVSRRRIANDNIRSTIGKSFSEADIKVLTKKVFQNIGRTLIEIARFEKLGPAGVKKIVQGDISLLKKIHDEGKGAIILTAHYGNWELLGSWPAALGYPMHFLVGRQHNPLVDEQLNSYRRQMGVGIIPLDSSLRATFKALKSNHFVGIAADQHAGAGIKMKFLGQQAMHARGPALFSIRTGAPICQFIMRRERLDRHVVIANQPIYPNQEAAEEEEIYRITAALVSFFEEHIKKFPEQWMWTHRRWKLQSD